MKRLLTHERIRLMIGLAVGVAIYGCAICAWANYTIIPETGDYTIAKDSVVLHGDVAPVKVVPPVVVPPVVIPDPPPVTPPTTPTGKLIPGGIKAAPVVISSAGTYTVQDDMVCDGGCIEIKASAVVLDLNGKTLTYNQTKPGDGVFVNYNSNAPTIRNGTIIQGAAMSEGDVYGIGNNPIRSVGVGNIKISGITARYGGRDVNGFHLKYVGVGLVENCTIEDTWNLGTMKNRHQGKSAIAAGDRFIVRNNTIINARQAGINVGDNSEVYGNTISINSMATNSSGIGGYKAKNVKVYGNTITGRGEHPLGIAFVSAGTDNIEIYGNTIDVQTTKLGEEYEGAGGNYAAGFRTTWGGNNINFHDNTIIVRTDSTYPGTRSSTGAAVKVNGKGRGLMVAINAGEKAKFTNNKITVLDKDGTGKAFGIACTGNNDGDMIFEGNTVTSNVLNVALGDEYGYCNGYPLFVRNTFIREGEAVAHKTIAAEMGGYFIGTGRFLDNVGVESININPASKTLKSVYFGKEVPGAAAQEGLPFDGTGAVYEYELHNRGATTLQERVLQ